MGVCEVAKCIVWLKIQIWYTASYFLSFFVSKLIHTIFESSYSKFSDHLFKFLFFNKSKMFIYVFSNIKLSFAI